MCGLKFSSLARGNPGCSDKFPGRKAAQRNGPGARHKFVTRFALLVLWVLPLTAADPGLDRLLASVEQRYNRAKTLQVGFEETYAVPGRPNRVESGDLFLRKPGRMRWEYRSPAGKLFLSDGKNIYYYNPSTKRAEKSKMKESEDLRAPLAFLLGRLDFDKDFQNFQATPEGGGTMIAASPKSDKLPYTQVQFLVAPDAQIRELRVVGYDKSLLTFRFGAEKVNPALAETLFRFELPAGAAWAPGATEGTER